MQQWRPCQSYNFACSIVHTWRVHRMYSIGRMWDNYKLKLYASINKSKILNEIELYISTPHTWTIIKHFHFITVTTINIERWHFNIVNVELNWNFRDEKLSAKKLHKIVWFCISPLLQPSPLSSASSSSSMSLSNYQSVDLDWLWHETHQFNACVIAFDYRAQRHARIHIYAFWTKKNEVFVETTRIGSW